MQATHDSVDVVDVKMQLLQSELTKLEGPLSEVWSTVESSGFRAAAVKEVQEARAARKDLKQVSTACTNAVRFCPACCNVLRFCTVLYRDTRHLCWNA